MPRNTTEPKNVLEPIPVDVNLASWFREGNAGSLKDLLFQEMFRKAEAILKENARPTRAGVRDTETNSLNHAWFAGYCDAFRDLRRLCHAPNKTQNFDPVTEWDHIT